MNVNHLKMLTICFLITFNVKNSYSKIKVGVLFPSNGPISPFSCIVEKAANKKLFEIKNYNTNDSTLGVVKSIKQALIDDVEIIIGARNTSQSLALLREIKEKKNMDVILPMASHDDLTLSYENSIRMVPSISENAKKVSSFIYEITKGKKKLAIINNLSMPYSISYAELVTTHLKHKIPAVNEYRIINGQDISEFIKNELQNESVFYLPLYTVQAFSLFEQLSMLDREITVFVQGGLLDEVEKVKNILKNRPNITVFFNNIWSGNIESNYKKEYLEVTKKCNANPNLVRSTLAFDAIKLLEKRTLLKSKSFNVNYFGILGNYVFNKNRNRISNLYIRELKSDLDHLHIR